MPVKVKAKEIAVRGVTGRVPMPEGVKKGLLNALMTPNGLILMIALFFANLYAAFEVARFKWRPVGLVCGLSAVLPVLGWVIFLILPRTAVAEQENARRRPSPAPACPWELRHQQPPRPRGAAPPWDFQSGWMPEAVVRTERRRCSNAARPRLTAAFSETQFPTFFRVVATEADRDLVIDVAAGKEQCRRKPRQPHLSLGNPFQDHQQPGGWRQLRRHHPGHTAPQGCRLRD